MGQRKRKENVEIQDGKNFYKSWIQSKPQC